MSKPTLYQIDVLADLGGSLEPGAWAQIQVDLLKQRGVLVPVKPDYEAAIKKSREAMSWADEEVMAGRMNDYDWWEVVLRAGVGAALGIGETP